MIDSVDLETLEPAIDISKTRFDIQPVDESERLRFAKQILFTLAGICIIVFAAYFWQPENKAISNIFELVKIGVLPLVTLVVSFYFPNSR